MFLNKAVVLCSALLIFPVTSFAQANKTPTSSDMSAVEIKEDRFGGGRVVTMRPQVLLDDPDHKLTISAESKKRANEPGTGISEIDDRIILDFISLASKSYSFGDRQLRFLVDGKPVDGGRASNRIFRGQDAARPELRVGEELIAGFSLARLKEISQGSKVEMRLGSFEFTLSDQVLANLRRFVSAAASTSGSSPGPR